MSFPLLEFLRQADKMPFKKRRKVFAGIRRQELPARETVSEELPARESVSEELPARESVSEELDDEVLSETAQVDAEAEAI